MGTLSNLAVGASELAIPLSKEVISNVGFASSPFEAFALANLGLSFSTGKTDTEFSWDESRYRPPGLRKQIAHGGVIGFKDNMALLAVLSTLYWHRTFIEK